MDSSRMLSVAEKVYKIFIFNPETARAVMEIFGGHYEWCWIIILLAAVAMWNVKFWNFFRDEREKLSLTIFRAVLEGLVHWCLSNATLYLALEANRLIYDAYTDYIPVDVRSAPGKNSGIRGLLSKIRIGDNTMVLVAQVRTPYIPFAMMMTTSMVALYLAYITTYDKPQTPAVA